MFSGDEERVTLLCTNDMANVIIDQFGRDTKLIKVDDDHFEAKVDVVVSNQFFGWIVALEGKVRVKETENVADRMSNLLKKVSE